MTKIDPDWTAPHGANEWRDDTILKATSWLKSFVPAARMEERTAAAKEYLLAAGTEWAQGRTSPAFDRRDTAAWYILQADTYAVGRQYWVPHYTSLIAPIMSCLGRHLDELRSLPGVDDRAGRLMNAEKAQPEGGLFELLVALAYKREGWDNVSFVPEQPGVGRTPDLLVARPRKNWAVECKTVGVSRYEATERERAEILARPAHQAALASTRSVVVEVRYKRELAGVPDNYLEHHVAAFIDDPRQTHWRDDYSVGRVREVDWRLCRRVMSKDYVYFGGSRMIELLVGFYRHQFEHSLVAKWRPAPSNPFYADAVYQASVVSWTSESDEALRRKARHFRSILGNANGQLPSDRPGVIHIGVESRAGMAVDAMRHLYNFVEFRDFVPRTSRLRWVYANILAPELTTRRDESWAINETTIPYMIGRHSTAEPMPGHLLLTPTHQKRAGVHWDGSGLT
jgi:hypothetical protein